MCARPEEADHRQEDIDNQSGKNRPDKPKQAVHDQERHQAERAAHGQLRTLLAQFVQSVQERVRSHLDLTHQYHQTDDDKDERGEAIRIGGRQDGEQYQSREQA